MLRYTSASILLATAILSGIVFVIFGYFTVVGVVDFFTVPVHCFNDGSCVHPTLAVLPITALFSFLAYRLMQNCRAYYAQNRKGG